MGKIDPSQIPSTLDVSPDAFAIRYTLQEIRRDADGAELAADPDAGPINEARRVELLREVRQGEPHELRLTALVFRQSDTKRPLLMAEASEANHNFLYFSPGELEGLAGSYKGRHFLRDHNHEELEAVGGKILESTAEKAGKWTVFRQVLHLVKPWAVEAALDGTLETFSIAWDRKARGWQGLKRSLFCTVCDAPFLGGECQHFPGDEVKLGKGPERAIVELEWRGVYGTETSGVSFPAVDKTGISDIRTALAAARSRTFPPKERRSMSMEALRKALGLSVDATPEEILEAQAKQLADSQRELKAEQLGRESVQFALDKTRAAQAEELAERRTAQIGALREDALNRGTFTPGDERDVLFLELCETDLDRGKRFLSTLEPAVPVGLPMQLKAPADPAPTGDTDREFKRVLTEEYGASPLEIQVQGSALRQLGLKPQDFIDHGQHTLWADDEEEEEV